MLPENLAEIALVFVAACTGNIQDLQISIFQKILRMPDSLLRDVIEEILSGFLFENITDIGRIAVDLSGQVVQIDTAFQMLQNVLPDPGDMVPLPVAVRAGGGVFIQKGYEILQDVEHKVQVCGGQ